MYISTRTDITVAKCLECKQARFAQQTEVLVKTLRVLAASPVLDEFLGYVLRSLTQQLGVQSGGIWLYDQAYQTTILQIDYEDGQIRRKEEILRPGASKQKRLQQWDAEYMPLLIRKQILIQNVQNLLQSPEYALTQIYNQQRGIKTIMVIPLLFGDIFRRVEQAKQLLLTGEFTITEVASCVGFANQGHLNRHFKRFFGVNPKQIRQKWQKRVRNSSPISLFFD